MGLFDKISKAVEDVTKAVEESGVIDAAKDVTESLAESGILGESAEAAGEAADADSASPHDSANVPDVPAGIIDPALLITIEDINEITGLGFDHAYPYRDEEWIGTTLTFETRSNRGYFELRVGKAPDGEVYEADGMWEFLTTEVSPQEPLEEVAPGAFRSAPDAIFFRVGNNVMHTVANFLDHEAETADWCVALAKRAADRAETLNAP